jgi:NAD(P)-dependent dehydrogenase (short-subunit alcohol dehydrogenase family)
MDRPTGARGKAGLKGKRALVTGSARGIGRRIIERLAEEECSVAIHYLTSSQDAKELASELTGRGTVAVALQADVTVEEDVMAMMERIRGEWGGLDILVNNVGNFLVRSLSELDSSEWHSIIDSNLHSVFYCCKHGLPMMRPGGWGRIINMAWTNAEYTKSAPETTPYDIAKSGVVTLSKSMAVEEAGHGITVNVISPGIIDTSRLSEEKRDEIMKEIPSGRLGTPEDIAEAVLFFVSEKSSYVTGTVMTVGGGWHLGRYRYYKESIL